MYISKQPFHYLTIWQLITYLNLKCLILNLTDPFTYPAWLLICVWLMAIVIIIFSSLHQTPMIYSVCCVGQLFLLCLYLRGVYFDNESSVCPADVCVLRLRRVWWRGAEAQDGGGDDMAWCPTSLLPSLLLPIFEPIAWQSVALQTCESISMPVQTLTKSRSLAVIRIDCLVLCLPIYIMDLSHSMMCFCQVLPH